MCAFIVKVRSDAVPCAQIGSTPLPPYIKRPSGVSNEDRERYQTVYSKQRGAIGSPNRRSAFHA